MDMEDLFKELLEVAQNWLSWNNGRNKAMVKKIKMDHLKFPQKVLWSEKTKNEHFDHQGQHNVGSKLKAYGEEWW